jgi:hypothetical protein
MSPVLTRALPGGSWAFLCCIERRMDAGLKPNVSSIASMSVSRWDAAVMGRVPDSLRNKLGVAVAQRTYKVCCDLLSSPNWQRAYNGGARPKRLLWAGTETVDHQDEDAASAVKSWIELISGIVSKSAALVQAQW